MRRGSLLAAALSTLVGVAVVTGCGGDDDSADAGAGGGAPKPPVRVALVSYEIPGAPSLNKMKAGADAALKQLAEEGGFGGRKVIIDTCNSRLEPAAAATCARQTLADKPIAMIGCELAWSAAGLKLYAAAKVPSINCPNTEEDFTNEWSFSITNGSGGGIAALTKWLCTRADIKTVLYVRPDLPSLAAGEQLGGPILDGCGKELLESVHYPLTAPDPTPYVNRAVRPDPDFVIFAGAGNSALPFITAFTRSGVPADRIASPDTNLTGEVLDALGASAEGVYSINQFHTWGDAGNPEVAAYLDAFEGSSADPRDPTVTWGYVYMMLLHTVAGEIGFDEFDSETLAEFLRTQTGVRIPVSRELTNPGPEGFPQLKQPYDQISQWNGDTMDIIEGGTEEGGWVRTHG